MTFSTVFLQSLPCSASSTITLLLKYLGIILEYRLVCEGSPRDPVVDIRQNMSFDSRGSPADVSTDIPLICHMSGGAAGLYYTCNHQTRSSKSLWLHPHCQWYRCIFPLGHHLLFDPDGRTTFKHIGYVWGEERGQEKLKSTDCIKKLIGRRLSSWIYVHVASLNTKVMKCFD